jgi:DNA-binding MarR family transcriptional regulator
VLRAHLKGASGHRLEQSQLDAVEIVAAASGGWRMTDFADVLRVDPSNATRAIDRLEQLGLAGRDRDEAERRVGAARSTPEGRKLVRDVTRLRAAGMARLLEDLDDDETERFADHLERFVRPTDRLVGELERER